MGWYEKVNELIWKVNGLIWKGKWGWYEKVIVQIWKGKGADMKGVDMKAIDLFYLNKKSRNLLKTGLWRTWGAGPLEYKKLRYENLNGLIWKFKWVDMKGKWVDIKI